MLDTRKLDEISAVCYINRGPFLTDLDPQKLFTENNKLGSPLEMEIHSSINSFYRYGSVVIYDELGIRESLPITCNEIISVVYRNTFREITESLPMVVHFNIFDIEEVVADSDQYNSRRFTGKLLKFHLVEAPFFLKYNEKAWKVAFGKTDDYTNTTTNNPIVTTRGESIDTIFTKHFKDNLHLISDDPKTDTIEVQFSKMKTKMHFLVPSWKSQKMFTYLLEFAKDESDYGNVKLFCTTNMQTSRPIVHLKSLNYIFKDISKPQTEFTLIDSSKIDGKPESLGGGQLNQILKHKFLFYDLSSIPAGFGGATLLNYDYVTGQYFTQCDNYVESNKKKGNSYTSNFGLWNEKISNEEVRQFYIGGINKSQGKEYLNNKIIKNRHQLRCEFMTYIDESLQPGDKILASFPSGMSELTKDQQTHLFDEHMTDEWIVEDVSDTYSNGKGLRKMVCMKDSFFNLYGKDNGIDVAKYLPPVKFVRSK